MQNEQLLTISDLCKMFSRKRAAIYRWSVDGRLPKAVKVRNRTIGWRVSDIEKWMEEGGAACLDDCDVNVEQGKAIEDSLNNKNEKLILIVERIAFAPNESMRSAAITDAIKLLAEFKSN